MITPGTLSFRQFKFRLGPIYAKRCLKAALDFCRIVQADCLMIDHDSYFSIWVHYHQKSSQRQSSSSQGNCTKAKISVLNEQFIQACQDELVDLIGPIGKLLVTQVRQSKTTQTPEMFVKQLTHSIPDPEKAKLFHNKFFPTRS